MDATQFDALARFVSPGASRREVLRYVASVVAGMLAIAELDVADARKKRKRKHKKKPMPPAHLPCGPCETYSDGICIPKSAGEACRAGAICLSNGSCAKTCVMAAECGGGCACGGSVEGGGYCIGNPVVACGPNALACTSTASCPRGYQCEPVSCNGNPANLCVPLCPA